MLKRLNIRNYALIDHLEIEFSNHLTIITGETGAGKSIVLGALGLIMGERADSKSFYDVTEKCIIEATFDVEKYDLIAFFTEHELDYETEMCIRREVSPTGKSRAFVNDTPVNNQVLQRITESLIDLHQQFDTLDIHHVNFQLRMVDALADNQKLLKTYQSDFRKYASDRKRLSELISQSETGVKEMEFQRFQLDELENAHLDPHEQQGLESELEQRSNAEQIIRVFALAANQLQETDPSVIGVLRDISRNIESVTRLSPHFKDIYERLSACIIELQEAAKDCERIEERTEHDPQRIQQVQERLNTLYKLQKKHQLESVEELIALKFRLSAMLSSFTDLGTTITHLQQEIENQETTLKAQAMVLSERRKKVIPDFEEKVNRMLAQLSMPDARIKVSLRDSSHLSTTGADEVEFLFSGNLGSRFLPIREVASGGELSRLTLCTKSLVADAIPLPTLIFDEIDAGISGDVSLKMGAILKELSNRHQVVSITHTPQVAARADKHYFVFKKNQDNRTVTNVRQLQPDERLRAIAVMLSGNPPSDAALHTARELMD
jgi:DNA repair protein RecN (Recombination protein N)